MKKEIVEFSVLFLLLILEDRFPFLPNNKKKWEHAAQNLSLKLFNLLVFYLLFYIGVSFAYKENLNFGLLNYLNLPFFIEIIIALLIYDFFMYFVHYLDHKIPLLWRFHRVHHTDIAIDSTTAFRTHIGSFLWMSTLQVFAFLPIIGASLENMLLIQIILYTVPIIHHSNIFIPKKIDDFLKLIFVTPSFHRVHHSAIQKETDSNYGVFFSIWDKIFKTYIDKRDLSSIQYGLNEFKDKEWLGLKGMLRTPFA